MIAVFTEGKAPMQTTIDGFAYIYCCGAPGGAIEARIGDKMYGLCVLSDEGYGYISVPAAGTYDLYAQGGTEKLTSVTVTERKKIYRSGLKLPYDFNSMTDEEMSKCIKLINGGQISANDLPWKVGDSRTITTYCGTSGSNNAELWSTNGGEFKIISDSNNDAVMRTDGKPARYAFELSPSNNGNNNCYYDSTGLPTKTLNSKWLNELAKPVIYKNISISADASKFNSVGVQTIAAKAAIKPLSFYDFSFLHKSYSTLKMRWDPYGSFDLTEDNFKQIMDALSKCRATPFLKVPDGLYDKYIFNHGGYSSGNVNYVTSYSDNNTNDVINLLTENTSLNDNKFSHMYFL